MLSLQCLQQWPHPRDVRADGKAPIRRGHEIDDDLLGRDWKLLLKQESRRLPPIAADWSAIQRGTKAPRRRQAQDDWLGAQILLSQMLGHGLGCIGVGGGGRSL